MRPLATTRNALIKHQQQAFRKLLAQLNEFRAEDIVHRFGTFKWLDLDARVRVQEYVPMTRQ